MPLVDTEVQNLSPVFSWHPANDPDPIDTVYYKLMLDTPDPGVVVFEVGTDTSFQVTNALMDNTEYFWQVMAEDVIGFQTINEGGYQTIYTNVSNEPPSAFTILSPIQLVRSIYSMSDYMKIVTKRVPGMMPSGAAGYHLFFWEY